MRLTENYSHSNFNAIMCLIHLNLDRFLDFEIYVYSVFPDILKVLFRFTCTKNIKVHKY